MAVKHRLILSLVATLVCASMWLQTQTAWAQAQAGVVVDAEGVLRTRLFSDAGGQLTRQRIAAAQQAIDADMARPSSMRKVSLNRLEKAIVDRNGAVTNEMRYLAGLQRVKYVLCYPDSGDVVLAGPAEGWFTNAAGRVVGIQSGRPVVRLEDLAVALRAFPPGSKGTSLIGCSIDPTQEGLASMQRFLHSIGSRATPGDTQFIVSGLRNSLGLQQVSINGVPPTTRFAQVLVEADYRMKLIGIGLERPPVRLISYVQRANPAQVARNAMQRWYFTPDYESVLVSDDRLAMELVGDGVKLIGANELVTAQGERRVAADGNKASQAFVSSFTEKYPQLAARSPIYAELRNLIDLAIAAAFMQCEDYYGRAGWTMPVLGDESRFSVERYTAPQSVESAVNAIWKGNRLMTPIGGGVEINAAKAVESAQPDTKGQVTRLRQETKVDLPEGQWWWD